MGMLPQKVLHGLKGKMGMACSGSASTSSLRMVSGESTWRLPVVCGDGRLLGALARARARTRTWAQSTARE